MEQREVYSQSISIRVVYQDLPDLIELETFVEARHWRGRGMAYASPVALCDDAAALAAWAREPVNEFKIETGADTGIGWLVLRFYTIDMAGHVSCQVTLATSGFTGRPEDASRLTLSMPTEPGLIERFARHLEWLCTTFEGEAVLEGLSA
jgi:hypothetical protein